MNLNLFNVLTSRGIINEGTALDAKGYTATEVTGLARKLSKGVRTYIYRDHVAGRLDTKVLVTDPETNAKAHILVSEINLVDGMPISRLAGIYGLSEEGEPVSMAPRRGRKPKNRDVA